MARVTKTDTIVEVTYRQLVSTLKTKEDRDYYRSLAEARNCTIDSLYGVIDTLQSGYDDIKEKRVIDSIISKKKSEQLANCEEYSTSLFEQNKQLIKDNKKIQRRAKIKSFTLSTALILTTTLFTTLLLVK